MLSQAMMETVFMIVLLIVLLIITLVLYGCVTQILEWIWPGNECFSYLKFCMAVPVFPKV